MWLGLLGLFVLSIVAMILRFRRSTGIERQQLRWFSFAAVFLAAYFIFSSVLESVGVTEGTLGEVISALGYLGLVAAIGVAILRYRLWDLDVVVKKTIVAGALVVLAVLVYAGAVALIGAFAMDRNRPALLFLIALVLGVAFRPGDAVRSADRRSPRLRNPRDAVRGVDRVLGARRHVLRDRGRAAPDSADPRGGDRLGRRAHLAPRRRDVPLGSRLADRRDLGGGGRFR